MSNRPTKLRVSSNVDDRLIAAGAKWFANMSYTSTPTVKNRDQVQTVGFLHKTKQRIVKKDKRKGNKKRRVSLGINSHNQWILLGESPRARNIYSVGAVAIKADMTATPPSAAYPKISAALRSRFTCGSSVPG